MFLLGTLVQPNTVASFTMWAALHPDDTVYVFVESGQASVYLSGAVLNGGPLFPSAEQAVPLTIPPIADTLALL
jgi:hypothetical protein